MSDPVDVNTRAALNLNNDGLPRGGQFARSECGMASRDKRDDSSDSDSDSSDEEDARAPFPVRSAAPLPRAAPFVNGAAQQPVVRASRPLLPTKASSQIPRSVPAPKIVTSKAAPAMRASPIRASAQVDVRAPAPTTVTAQANGSVTDRTYAEEYDYAVGPDESTTFSRSIALTWRATPEEMATTQDACRFELDEEKLVELFKVQAKNPDLALTNPDAYKPERVRLDKVFLHKVNLRQVYSSGYDAIVVVADEKRLKFLNNVCVGRGSAGMVVINPLANQVLAGKEGQNIVDNSNVSRSKTFTTFGHTSIDRFVDDIIFPSTDSEDQRCQVRPKSQLTKLILDNYPSISAKHKLPEVAVIGDAGGPLLNHEHIVDVLESYAKNIKPLLSPIIDATKPLSFEIHPVTGSWNEAIAMKEFENNRGRPIVVSVVLEVEYSFPRSSFGHYERTKVIRPDTKALFYGLAKGRELL